MNQILTVTQPQIKSELAEYASQYSSIETPGINSVCFSPSGRYLVVGDAAGRVTVRFYLPYSLLWILIFLIFFFQVWDIPNKRVRSIFRVISSVRSVDFSSNDRFVVSASWDNAVCIWNTRDGSAKVFMDGTEVVWSVRFSPNGQFVAAGDSDGVIRTWDVRTGQLVRRWTGHKSTICSVAFTPDGKVLLSGGNGGDVKYWDVSSLGIGGEPVPTKVLGCKDRAVCRVLTFILVPLANFLFFSVRSLPSLFLLMVSGSPTVYAITQRLSGMPTVPCDNAH